MAKIWIEKVENRIWLHGWAGPQTPALCKSIGGGRWSPSEKVWRYPLDLGTCRRMREIFRDALVIGPDLNTWARIQKTQETEMLELAFKHDTNLSNIPALHPKIAEAMSTRTYQKNASIFGAIAESFGLFDEPGLGKTLETLGALIESNDAGKGIHLILCPKVAVRSVWAREIARWLVADRNLAIYPVQGDRTARQKTLTAAMTDRSETIYVIANIEMARIRPHRDDNGNVKYKIDDAEYPDLFTKVWDSVIVDESHRALIRTKGTPTQVRAGMTKLRSRRRIALSGTPMRGKPEQLWGTLNWLRPDLYTSYWNWVTRYFQMSNNGFSNHVIGDLQVGASDRMQRDQASLILRRTKAEVLRELPPITYAGSYLDPEDDNSPFGVWLDMDSKHEKQYHEFAENASVDFDNGEFMFADGALPYYTRSKQLASSLCSMVDGKLIPTTDSVKFDWLFDKCVELGIIDNDSNVKKIVVASQSTVLINAFATKFREKGISCYVLTGETSDRHREKMMDDFQDNPASPRVFFLNTMAGGVAITLDAADDLVLLDETAVPDDQIQVINRVHRASRIHSVTVSVLRSLGTIEESIAWIVASRENVQDYLLDGSRGVDYARQRYTDSRQRSAASRDRKANA